MAQTPNTLQEAITYFSNPENCRNYVIVRRWPNGVMCPRCGSSNVAWQPKYNRWQCNVRHPRRQFTVKTGTIFEDSPLSLDKWLCAMWQVVNCKNGVSSYEVHRAIGVTQKTAWFMDHRIRLALRMGSFAKMSGEIEVDETFIGGKARNMQGPRYPLKTWPQDEARFKELILYISQKCATDPKFGAVKLNKILFFSDFLAFAQLGEPITGFEYQKLARGPAPRRFIPIRDQMIENGELAIQEIPLRSGNVQYRTINLRRPNLSVFTAEQIALVDGVIQALLEADAETVSELSHTMVGWKIVDFGETIPYETVFLSDEPLTEADIERGKALAKLPKLGSEEI